jgi:hypothetical protein
MTPPVAPATTATVPRAPEGSALAHWSAPRISFRSVLLPEAANTQHRSPDRPGPSAPSLHSGQHLDGAYAAALHGARHQGDTTPAAPRRGQHLDEDDPLDPLQRHRAAFAPLDSLAGPLPFGGAGPSNAPAASAASSARAASSLEDLLPALVRRIAWSGDRQRGVVRLELGAGELAGATLLVHAEGGRVRVHLDVPAGVDTRQWQRRISERLASRGVPTDEVEVT